MALGIARNAIDALIDLAHVKRPERSAGTLREDRGAQARIAHAEAEHHLADGLPVGAPEVAEVGQSDREIDGEGAGVAAPGHPFDQAEEHREHDQVDQSGDDPKPGVGEVRGRGVSQGWRIICGPLQPEAQLWN